MREALIAYADYIFLRIIKPKTIQNIFFIYYSNEPDNFICLLTERLNIWPHKDIYILYPEGIWKYEDGSYQTVEDNMIFYEGYPGVIINLTWPPFASYEWATCMTKFLMRLQRTCSTCSVPIAHQEWANKLFGQDTPEIGMEKLWKVVLSFFPIPLDYKKACEHLESILELAKRLTNQRFAAIHITNDDGTDLLVPLHPNHQWVTSYENEHCTNLPINEVYTVPIKDGVYGKYICYGPMEINGIIVKNVEIHFQSGRAFFMKAEGDFCQLEKLLNTDYGAKYMGEIALVMKTEVSSEDVSTLNSLLDENHFCHFALGNAYINCILGGSKKTIKTLIHERVNLSTIHADFWISSKGLSVTGILGNDEKIILIDDGKTVW